MKSKPGISTPLLAVADRFLTGLRSGIIVRASDMASIHIIIYTLKTDDGALYCAQLDYQRYPFRHALLLLALESGFPVSMDADADYHISNLALRLPRAMALPTLDAHWTLFDDIRSGTIVQADDADSLNTIGYVMRGQDGSHHCAQIDPAANPNRNQLLMMAFKSGLPVTVACNSNYHAATVSVGSRSFGPNIDCATSVVGSTPRSGMIDEIIDKDVSDALCFVLKTSDGKRYRAKIDRAKQENRINLVMMALRSDLPVTLFADSDNAVSEIAVGSRLFNEPPSLMSFDRKLTGTHTGIVVRIIDSDALENVRYVLHGLDGTQYCAQLETGTRTRRHLLLMMAMARKLPVTIEADQRSMITGVAVGLPRLGSPSFDCGAMRSSGTNSGDIVRMVDSDVWGNVVQYMLQTSSGERWCVPASAVSQTTRCDLLRLALTCGLTVHVEGTDRPDSSARVTVERK